MTRKKAKPLTPTQLENIKHLIAELQRPIELQDFYSEVLAYFNGFDGEKNPVLRIRLTENLLEKFIRIMEGRR